jgi:hypothetical protein
MSVAFAFLLTRNQFYTHYFSSGAYALFEILLYTDKAAVLAG